jgi:hypothetical protein
VAELQTGIAAIVKAIQFAPTVVSARMRRVLGSVTEHVFKRTASPVILRQDKTPVAPATFATAVLATMEQENGAKGPLGTW